jgi:hypothetical protein
MVDKMMRVAGRDFNGVAKPLQINYGRLNVDPIKSMFPEYQLEFKGQVSNDDVYESWLSFPDKKLISRGVSRILPWTDLKAGTRTLPTFDITTLQGTIAFVHHTPHGVAYITRDFATKTTYFYYATDLDATPTLVTQYDGGTAISMTCNSYFDYVHNIVLVGIYDQTIPSKSLPLYLSSDGGQTWNIIKTTTVVDASVNSHWHTAQFDPYNGRIWASEGDGDNRAINWSDDFGRTWDRIIGTHQPTLIAPFPTQVFFGEDASIQKPGLTVYKKRPTEHPVTINEALTFRTDKSANWNYPEGPYYPTGRIGYILFTPKTEPLNDMQYIYATGDGGNSWHCVWSAPREFARIESLLYVPYDNVVVARLRTHYKSGVNKLVYAEAVKWY